MRVNPELLRAQQFVEYTIAYYCIVYTLLRGGRRGLINEASSEIKLDKDMYHS